MSIIVMSMQTLPTTSATLPFTIILPAPLPKLRGSHQHIQDKTVAMDVLPRVTPFRLYPPLPRSTCFIWAMWI